MLRAILCLKKRGSGKHLVIPFILFAHLQMTECLAQNLILNSGVNKVNLVELYSSEGCSSCPPADRWLAKLRVTKGLWNKFVPVEFHVDYWNSLGWIDPYSRKQFSARQRSYAREWRTPRIYTPGFVLNGKEWRSRSLSKLNRSSSRPGNLNVKQLSLSSFQVLFTPLTKSSGPLRVFASILGSGLEVKVKSGENQGSILKHEFVALEVKQVRLKKTARGFVATIRFNKSYKAKPKKLSIAFWVSLADFLEPIQAVGGDIDKLF